MCNNGVSEVYTYLAFSFEGRICVEIGAKILLLLISKNNSKLTKLYMYLLAETKCFPKVFSQKELLTSIGLSIRSEGTIKKITDILIEKGFLEVYKYKDSKGINRIQYKVK